MPDCCVAAGCSNTSKQEGISLFHFPKNELLKKEWAKQIQRTRDSWKGPTKYSVVCSEHFSDDCFMEDYKLHHSFGMDRVRKLKDTAVPTIFKRKASEIADEPKAKKRRNVYEKRDHQRVCVCYRYDHCYVYHIQYRLLKR